MPLMSAENRATDRHKKSRGPKAGNREQKYNRLRKFRAASGYAEPRDCYQRLSLTGGAALAWMSQLREAQNLDTSLFKHPTDFRDGRHDP
jgi:hypothetical protein